MLCASSHQDHYVCTFSYFLAKSQKKYILLRRNCFSERSYEEKFYAKALAFDTHVTAIGPCLSGLDQSDEGCSQSRRGAESSDHPFLLRTTTFAGFHNLGIMWKPLKSIFLTSFLTEYYHGLVGHPRVQLGDTNLIGQRLQPSNLEFFGGLYSLSLCPNLFLTFHLSSFRYPFCRTSSRRSPPFSSKAQVFPLSAAIIRCS